MHSSSNVCSYSVATYSALADLENALIQIRLGSSVPAFLSTSTTAGSWRSTGTPSTTLTTLKLLYVWANTSVRYSGSFSLARVHSAPARAAKAKVGTISLSSVTHSLKSTRAAQKTALHLPHRRSLASLARSVASLRQALHISSSGDSNPALGDFGSSSGWHPS